MNKISKSVFFGAITCFIIFFVCGNFTKNMSDSSMIIAVTIVLCGIVVACTSWVVDTIKEYMPKEKSDLISK